MLGEKVDNEHARKHATLYTKTMEELHPEAIEAGMGYKYRKNRLPQLTDPNKLVATTKDDFVKDMLNLVDFSKYKNIDGSLWSREQMTYFLEDHYFERLTSKSKTAFSPYDSSIKDRRSHERTIHYKDADSYLDFLEQYGVSTDITRVMNAELRAWSRDIVISRELGSDADVFVKKMVEKYHVEDLIAASGDKNLISKTGSNKLDNLKDSILSMWDVLSRGETVENKVWANLMAGLRSITAAAQLGQHPIGALLEDTWISRQYLARIGIDAKEVERITSLPFEERKKLLSDVGILADHGIAHGRRDIEGGEFANAGEVIHAKMNYLSGMDYIDKRNKSTVALVIYNQIGRMADSYSSLKALMVDPNLDPKVKMFFKQLDESDFQVIKRAKPISCPDGDLSARTPNSITAVKDEHLKDFIAPLISEKTAWHTRQLEELKAKRQRKIDQEIRKQRKEDLSSSLQDYLKSDIQEISTQLQSLTASETNLLKDKVANKLNALVLDFMQTSLRGAMGSSLHDRQRLGLLTYKRGTFAGELGV